MHPPSSCSSWPIRWGQRFLPKLARIAPRLEYEAKVTLLWIAAILGLHLAGRSAGTLGLLG